MKMEVLTGLVTNQVLMSAVFGWLTAQVLKTMIDIWYSKSFSPDRLWGSGGMPSSHSATVTALATAAACHYGLSSFEFAISVILAIIVMYDAMGVRRETGKQSKLLNMLLEADLFGEGFADFEGTLKELVGHTPLQVFMGAVLGTGIALMINRFF